MSKPIESAKEFAVVLCSRYASVDDSTSELEELAGDIEARYNAVRLATFDEFEALMLERLRVADVASSILYALLTLRAKYSGSPGEPK